MPLCFLIQNFAEIGQSVDELWPKKQFSIFGHVTVMVFNICCMNQILSKLHDFSLRYGNLAIFKMMAVHHLGFVMKSQYCIAGHIFVVQILS